MIKVPLPPNVTILKKYHQHVSGRDHKLKTVVGEMSSSTTDNRIRVIAHRAVNQHYEIIAVKLFWTFQCNCCGHWKDYIAIQVMN